MNWKALVLGDEIGIPVLISICKKIPAEVIGSSWSNKVSDKSINLTKTINGIFVPDLHHNSNSLKSFIINKGINLLLVYSYDSINKSNVLDLPNVSKVNIHAGAVPEYRGANALNWVLIDGMTKMGVTIHEITPNVDSGPVIASFSIEIDFEDTAVSLQSELNVKLVESIPPILKSYLVGTLRAIPQEFLNHPHLKRRKPEDGLFDWNFSDKQIYDLIRALVHPWPGARYYDKNGQQVIISEYMSMNDIKKLRVYECS
jgi:methionyl-tRNA formyltransferase